MTNTLTQSEVVQLWREITGNSELAVTVINGHVTVYDIEHSDSQKLFTYYKFNSLFLNLNNIYTIPKSTKLSNRIWMNVKNVLGFELNGKKWSLSK
jgi:O-phosphoseryl-tRNA(Cys) synthetase